MSLRDDNARFALLKAIVDAATAEIAQLRTGHTERLVERYKDEGTKSFDAFLPDNRKVATITLTVPKPALKVVDEAAFLAWVKTNHPDAIQVVVHEAEPEQVIPASPEWREEVVSPKALTTLLEQFQSADDGVVDLATGVMVDGVEMTPAADPKQFSVLYTKDGRNQLADAYRAGKLDALAEGTTLPAIGSGK